MNDVQGITERIFGEKKKSATIIDLWHQLMVTYGWIPLEEFLNLDARIVSKLNYRINEDGKKMNGVRK